MYKNLFRIKKEIDDTIIIDERNLFKLKKEIDDTTIKDIRNLFRLKKKDQNKDRIIRNIRKFFDHEEEYYHKPVRVGNCWSINCIEYESNTIEIEHYQLKNISIKLDHT